MSKKQDPAYGDKLAKIVAEQRGQLVDDLQALQRHDRVLPADDPHIEEMERRVCDRTELISKMETGVMHHTSQ